MFYVWFLWQLLREPPVMLKLALLFVNHPYVISELFYTPARNAVWACPPVSS
jgi:hypothetical protein